MTRNEHELGTILRNIFRAACPAPLRLKIKNAARNLKRGLTARGVFTTIYKRNDWGSDVSVSGQGSDLEQTAVIREEIPRLLQELGVRTMLDAPCGDFAWMKQVALDLDDYVGGDIVRELIDADQREYGRPGRRFMTLDVTRDELPRVELIFCRDCLVHLPYRMIFAALENFKRSGARYLLTTTFPDRPENSDIMLGQWRPLNLQRPPFNMPPPLRAINEHCTQQGGIYADKTLALWKIN